MKRHEHSRGITARTLTVAVGLALVVGVVLMWSWNTIAAGLFQAPLAGFKHAMALELAVIALSGIAAACTRVAMGEN